MLVSKVSIFNLRSIKQLVDIDLSHGFDVFIGQNDCGKSTILYALQVFFKIDDNFQFENDQNQKNDLSFHSVEHQLEQGFSIDKDEIGIMCTLKLDTGDLKQVESELLKHEINGEITILKKCAKEARYDGSKSSKKSTGYFVVNKRFDNADFDSLLQKKESELTNIMDKYPKSKAYLQNSNEVGKPTNNERLSALQKYAEETQKNTIKFDKFNFPSKGDQIWPDFSLIDTKTALDGKHKVIEDAFKKIDKEIEKTFAKNIGEIKKVAEGKYKRITDQIKVYAQKNYVPQIEEFRAIPTVKLSMGRDLVMKRSGQKELSHFEFQGDGTKRRMMVAILQAGATLIGQLTDDIQEEATLSDLDPPKEEPYTPLNIWAFDEPELHLHPGAQRDLFNSLTKFAGYDFQIVCSTHSTIFVNNLNLESVHIVELDSNLESICFQKDSGIEDIIKSSLGIKNSDIFFSNLFVVVEGATELGAFPILFEKIYGQSLSACGIALIDGEGQSESKAKVDFLLKNLKNAICLFDSDVKYNLNRELESYEKSNSIIYIGTADFEDAFADEVWLDILCSNFNLVESGSTIWTTQVLNQLRQNISASKNDKNKKWLKILENYYRRKCRDLNTNGNDGHPYNFDKVEIGQKLAATAVSLNKIPKEIIELIDKIREKIS